MQDPEYTIDVSEIQQDDQTIGDRMVDTRRMKLEVREAQTRNLVAGVRFDMAGQINHPKIGDVEIDSDSQAEISNTEAKHLAQAGRDIALSGSGKMACEHLLTALLH